MIPGMAGYQRNHANDSDNDTTDSYDDVHIATPSQYWRCCFVSILSVELIFSVYFALIIFWICALVEPFVLAEFSYFVVGFTFPVLPVSILLVLVVNDTERSPSRVAFVSVLTLAGQIAGLVVLLIFIWRPSVDFKQLCDGYTMYDQQDIFVGSYANACHFTGYDYAIGAKYWILFGLFLPKSISFVVTLVSALRCAAFADMECCDECATAFRWHERPTGRAGDEDFLDSAVSEWTWHWPGGDWWTALAPALLAVAIVVAVYPCATLPMFREVGGFCGDRGLIGDARVTHVILSTAYYKENMIDSLFVRSCVQSMNPFSACINLQYNFSKLGLSVVPRQYSLASNYELEQPDYMECDEDVVELAHKQGNELFGAALSQHRSNSVATDE